MMQSRAMCNWGKKKKMLYSRQGFSLIHPHNKAIISHVWTEITSPCLLVCLFFLSVCPSAGLYQNCLAVFHET